MTAQVAHALSSINSTVTGHAVRKDNTANNPQYSTIELSNDKTESTRHYEGIMLLAYEGGQVLWSGVIVLCPSGWVMR